MGLLGDTFGIMGGLARGATSASLWTCNMIFTGLQNAKTKKQVKEIYQRAYEANLANRAVAVLPETDKQQLLLTSGEPDDNDVYVLDTKSNTAALDHIWGEDGSLDSVVITGGRNNDRVCALLPFVRKTQIEDKPVIVLHTGNSELETMVQDEDNSRDYEFISGTACYYDVFRGMPTDDIAYLLYETMPKDSASPAAESLMRALIEVLLITEGKITLHNLAAFPLISLKKKIDELNNNGQLTGDEYDEINNYCMAGSSETASVRIFLNNVNRQFEAVYGKTYSKSSNIKRMLNQNGVIAINVGNSGNDLLTELVLNHLQLLQSQGRDFALLLDNIPISKYEKISDLIRGHQYAISSQDFVSSLCGGERKSEELFSEIMGNVNTTVVFRHSSGLSCQKWSDYFGKYHKIRIRYSIAQNDAFMNTSNSRGLTVDETDEPRISEQTIKQLSGGLACIHIIDYILIAEVKYPNN
ncbi:hypothetical protein SAMN02910456_01215 [Ruminococcaceae bacterium YRB3002]|nr:hypothetical protein SAMN02910456_01215 [Ruminococcaceae bacterium YRB3002]